MVHNGGAPDFVYVGWNGKILGRFGPIDHIVMRGAGGDDVLVVKSSVRIPAVIDGGSGDDCVQGGSGADVLLGGDGDDVLIAGTGRPALDGGSGNDRILVPHRMGELRFAPSADSEVVRKLDQIYKLEPLSHDEDAGGATKKLPSPILVGAADLGNEQIRPLLHRAYAAGQAIVLTSATETDAERLRSLIGHPNSAKWKQEDKEGKAANKKPELVLFRRSSRPGSKAYDYRAGYFASLPHSFDDWTTELASRVFSATAIVPQAPGGSSSNDLQKLADSYTTSAMNQNASGDSIQEVNSVWGVRSFRNQADFYYVLQEMDYRNANEVILTFDQATSSIYPSSATQTSLLQTSPGSTSCTTSTTSGTSWSIGGSAGWNQLQGLNAALTGGVSVSNSETITCPQTAVTNTSNPASSQPSWTYVIRKPRAGNLATFYNQWIWEVPFTGYQEGQDQLVLDSEIEQTPFNIETYPTLGVNLQSAVPRPFGNTFALQDPEVLTVNPTCVNAGNTFTINGNGLYPSLVSSVLVGGSALPSTAYSSVSDTSIKVVAPYQSGYYLPVVVQTGEGVSNANVTIEISVLGLCGD